MSSPISVGVTGGIGSGKTLVTKLFSILNVPIYYADDRAKILMNTSLQVPISSEFGMESYVEGKLNRDYIASKVFSNITALEKLNAIVHPAIANDFENWINTQKKADYVIKEAALLVETGSYKQLDKLIVVISSQELRVERIKLRDEFRSEEEILNIISKQTTDAEKTQLADFVISNNEQELLIPQVLEIDKKIRQH